MTEETPPAVEQNGFAFDMVLDGRHMTVSYNPGEEFLICVDGEEIAVEDMQYFQIWDRALTAEEMRGMM